MLERYPLRFMGAACILRLEEGVCRYVLAVTALNFDDCLLKNCVGHPVSRQSLLSSPFSQQFVFKLTT